MGSVAESERSPLASPGRIALASGSNATAKIETRMAKKKNQHPGTAPAAAPTGGAGGTLIAQQTYATIGTFLRLPRAHDLNGAEHVFLGVPYDTATTFRPGARFGPQATRAGSAQLAELKSFPHGFNPLDHVKAVDYGDVYFDHSAPHTIPGAIERAAAGIIKHDVFLTTFGGDHFITYPLLKAHAAKYGPLALIHFDAHPDTWPETEGKNVELNHGTMFWRAVKEGLIVPSKSVQTGIRTWVDDKMGLTIIGAPEVHEKGPAAVLEKIKKIVGRHPAYLNFDIDCLDPAFAFQILRGLGSLNIVGMDVVEVAPAYDQAEITAIAAATIAYDQLCLRAIRKGAKSQG
jgi:agmatinase